MTNAVMGIGEKTGNESRVLPVLRIHSKAWGADLHSLSPFWILAGWSQKVTSRRAEQAGERG